MKPDVPAAAYRICAFLGAIVLGLITHAHVGFADSNSASRPQRDRIARDQLLGLEFFSEGGGMHLPPDLLEFIDDRLIEPFGRAGDRVKKERFSHKWGLTWDDESKEPVGLFRKKYRGMSVGVLGCAGCHSGKAAGRFIVGLGNKNIDVHEIGKTVTRVGAIWRKFGKRNSNKSEDYRYVEKSAMDFAGLLARSDITNLTQGLVPTSIVRTWFYHYGNRPLPKNLPRAAVKVPHFWGYEQKKKVGQFCDGMGDGREPGWGIAVELASGQRPEPVRGYLHKIAEAEELIGDILPPAYPFQNEINAAKAGRGKAVFAKTCSGCHGNYERDEQGLPLIAAPKLISWNKVRTDRDRLNAITDEFLELVATNPLNDVLRSNGKTESYFAPRLEGIWARFPYLHNGSVPTIHDLLEKPERRPEFFSLHDAGEEKRFDRVRLGLTVPRRPTVELIQLYRGARRGERWIYYTRRDGQSNAGHPFGTNLAKSQKSDLIEYLKTL